MPHCAIGVDVIVGFPGETDELFKETYDFYMSLMFRICMYLPIAKDQHTCCRNEGCSSNECKE